MEEWELEVMVSNATGLKKVSTLEQNPYCSVWYTQGDARRICTHKNGGTNPTWDKVVRLPIKHTHLESLYGSVLVEIVHESRVRDGRIGTAIIPLLDLRRGEGAIRMYDVDPVGKVGVALMRKKKEAAAFTSAARVEVQTGGGSVGHISPTSKSGYSIRTCFTKIMTIANGVNSIATTKDNLLKLHKDMHKGGLASS